ncbi:TonB-dependent receptor [Aurantiacibacter rhizosphaerae]|uniref:TonB-dependent receptor n=1 Tax=Aurantiacibacter rhizosphaerae TaxID=2691582 RepID=A0A844X950_9SPHN|nr:TonB-dependent receptor [Aurantiacibacter rhizosphaerae]MWV26857.1 TonB-dependent receptor [Aurantiacibacter rhizosphaerae]
MNTKKTRLTRISALPLSGCVALCLAGLPGTALAQDQSQDQNEVNQNSNEIIVTAQKREERLRDVPVPVTAVGGADLLATNQTKAQDFFSSVPGVNLQFQNNRAQLAIRGITTSPVTGNPVVGFVIDDVPYGSSTGQGGLFGAAPDIDPSELARVEVLRGPQGTLYGASSIGGLVKYVTIQPKLGILEGSVGGGVQLVRGGGQTLGYSARGAINVPLGDDFAIRASAFTREEPGYIDNVRTGEDDINSSRVTGGRLSALWEPSDSFALTLGAMYQVRDIYGSSNVDARTGSFYEQTDQLGSGRSQSEIQMYRAQIEADLGAVDLTSITAFSRSTNYDNQDFTASPLTVFLFPAIFPPTIPEFGNVLLQTYDVDKISHETRFAGSIGDMFDWIVGGFYTHEKGNYTIDTFAINPLDGDVYGVPVVWRDDIKYQEYAAFANVTAQLTDRFDIQFGGRYSRNDQEMTHREWFQGLPYPADPFYSTTNPEASGEAFTYQIAPRFKPTPDHMIYGRLATGYRPGGPNAGCNDDPVEPVPCEFKPDKTVNYELGAKGELLDGVMSYDVSLFHIDWTDIQITQVSSLGTFTFNSNAGMARSRGFELALEVRPTDGLTLAGWYAFVDATLQEGFASEALFAEEGDRLPFSSRHSGRFSVDYETPIAAGDAFAMFGASATYVGERKGEFVPFPAAAPLRASYPGYVQFDAHAGLDFDNWNVNLFVQNLTNKHGVIGGGFYNQSTFNENWFNYTQPRTVGINVAYDF